MEIRSASLLFLPIALTVMSADVDASCSDRPGTPTIVNVIGISQTQVLVNWINKAGNDETVFWDVHMTDPAGNVFPQRPGLPPAIRGFNVPVSNSFDVGAAGTTRCFQIRARTGPHSEGCVSEKFSNKVCGTSLLPPDAHPVKKPPKHFELGR